MKLHNNYLVVCLLLSANIVWSQPINRKQLVERHTIVNTKYDSLASLSVGNGNFAFTADITGLQSFPEAYAGGVPLGTQSVWGWHSFTDTAGYRFDETLTQYQLNDRNVPYSVQASTPERKKNAVNWFRQNPHRLQLGNIGLVIIKKDGTEAGLHDIQSVKQTLNPWTGEIHSYFTVENIPVEVFTYCHQQQDVIGVKIHSSLLQEKRLFIRLRFPFPSTEFKDVGTNFINPDKHRSDFIRNENGGSIIRLIDTTRYQVQLFSQQSVTVEKKQDHDFRVIPATTGDFAISFRFTGSTDRKPVPSVAAVARNSREQWQQFWQSGGAIDLSGNTDTRANELERRIILSQYLTKIQCAGNYPPQETGLTYNSWYGKPHLEMHWWHAVHFALWGRTAILEKQLEWYHTAYAQAKKMAERQGYEGVRWQKMTDNTGGETSSSVGAFLLWQQPHLIYFAELVHRDKKQDAILRKYKDLVFATADFMASFAYYDPAKKKYILGKGVMPAQERYKPEETFNPGYELAYWHWALETAQQWRQRLQLPRHPKWDAVLKDLSPLPVQDGKYLFTENTTDSYTNPHFRTDHPSIFGALGMLPKTVMTDTALMRRTFDWIWKNWSWDETWGWDFPMTAMTATRLGLPGKAIDALLMPVQTNTYLVNGHNYQDGRLTLYMPGNGGLLAAIAMMCAGYDGTAKQHPGIPKGWKIRYEGLRKMP